MKKISEYSITARGGHFNVDMMREGLSWKAILRGQHIPPVPILQPSERVPEMEERAYDTEELHGQSEEELLEMVRKRVDEMAGPLDAMQKR